MKGTIFERGKKLKNKINRELAWFRVRKYLLTMKRKEYKSMVAYTIFGIIMFPVVIGYGMWKILDKVVPVIVDLVTEEKEEKTIVPEE